MKSRFLKVMSLVLTIIFSLSLCAFADQYDTMLIDDENNELPTFTDLAADDWAYEAIAYLVQKGVVSGDETGAVAPDNGITREEVAKMLVVARGYEINNDVVLDITDSQTVSDWAIPYVAKALEKGILTGDENAEIRGNSVVTRAEMATLVVRSLNASIDGFEASSFADITNDDWYAKYVECAKTLGIVNGYEDGTFGGDNLVTRREAFVMVQRLVRLLVALEA